MHSFVINALAFAGVMASAVDVWAGWVTLRNDTTQTVLVQEMTATGGKVLRGRCIRLLPGETYRDYRTNVGEKLVRVTDDASPARLITEDTMIWGTQDKTYIIQSTKTGSKLVPMPAEIAGGKK